jgi:signal transduction histidine kinase
VALGTGFVNKYRFDVFFRTTCNVIILQIGFAFIIIISIAIGFNYLYNDILATLLSGLNEGLRFPGAVPETSGLIAQNIEYIRTKGFVLTATAIAAITIALGYIIARITLRPARNTLSSQKQFIGNIAHELRTPLAIIKTNIEVGLIDDDMTEKQKKIFQSNLEELDRISDIINNLLSFNALLRPEKMDFENVDLGDVVTETLKKLANLSDLKEQDIIVKKGEFRVVHGNRIALEQITMNLLKNAIAYTPSHGSITITITPDYRNFIELRVQDTGMGIARKDLFHVFEPFYRSDRSRARRHGGSGLGLTIVSELVKMHRGKITLQSIPQKGTTVIVSLPCGDSNRNSTQKDSDTDEEIAVDFSRHRK